MLPQDKLNLTIDDLLVKCPDCDGRGYVPNKAWEQFNPDRDDAAVFCDMHGDDHLWCAECEGGGKVVTQTGMAIAQLFHYLQRK